jgi:hypothetical protein
VQLEKLQNAIEAAEGLAAVRVAKEELRSQGVDLAGRQAERLGVLDGPHADAVQEPAAA